ncbi:Pycsar system effector family protein [Dermacoccus abyssi]
MTEPPAPVSLSDSREVDPDTAWKSLALVVDWIKHAETKAAATLAGVGVGAGVLFNVTKDVKTWPGLMATAVGTCVALLVLAGTCAGMALRPRLRHELPGRSLLFYRDVSHAHPKESKGGAYIAAIQELSADPQSIVAEVAAQAWANAHVATRKYVWAGLAINALLFALGALALVVLILAVQR